MTSVEAANVDDPWEASMRSARPRWWGEWPVLASIVPASLIVASVTVARTPEWSFWPVFGASAGAFILLFGGLVVFRAVVGVRFARVRALWPEALVFEASRCPQSDAAIRGLSASRSRPARWSVIAVDVTGLRWYLADPELSDCVFFAVADIVEVEPTTVTVRDGYGGRQVPAVQLRLRGEEAWSIAIVPRSERWNAPFRFAASSDDRDMLLRHLRSRLGADEALPA